MAIQFQLRRGTTAENNSFVGAAGEMTLDTTNNEIRVHDGTTTGGYKVPVLVYVQYPTAANNYTWARKWSDGWVEQGGICKLIENNSNYLQALPVTMADGNYTVTIAQCASSDSGYEGFYTNQGCVLARTTTTVTLSNRRFIGEASRTLDIMWRVEGLAA